MRRLDETGLDYGAAVLSVCGLLGLVDSVYNYFATGDGIDHTPGALLVIISSALILLAALAVMRWRRLPRLVRVLLDVLLFLGLVGTGLAAYFLEANILMALMVLGLLGWLAHESGLTTPRHSLAAPELSR